MDVFLRIDINIVAMLLLLAVFFIAKKSLDPEDELTQLFKRVSLVISIELFFEAMTCILNQMEGSFVAPAAYFLHICLFTVAPILSYNWYRFISRWIHIRDIRLPKNTLLLVPVAVNFVLTLLSPFYGFVFYINEANKYVRGDFFPLSMGITYFYIVLAVFSIFHRRRKLVKEEYLPLMLFGVLPLVGAFLQGLFYGVLLMWSTCAFSLVIVYNFLQQRMVHIDSLTGAWARSSFEYYLGQRVRQKSEKDFALIFFDLDGLKQINDSYGHSAGDEALKTTIRLVRSCLKKTDVIARFGGDEFIVLLDDINKIQLNQVMRRFTNTFQKYNEQGEKSYTLSCSYGADVYDPTCYDLDQFIHYLDDLMYKNKKAKELSFAFRNSVHKPENGNDLTDPPYQP